MTRSALNPRRMPVVIARIKHRTSAPTVAGHAFELQGESPAMSSRTRNGSGRAAMRSATATFRAARLHEGGSGPRPAPSSRCLCHHCCSDPSTGLRRRPPDLEICARARHSCLLFQTPVLPSRGCLPNEALNKWARARRAAKSGTFRHGAQSWCETHVLCNLLLSLSILTYSNSTL